MSLSISSRGDFKNIEKFLKKSFGRKYEDILEKYGEEGVAALEAATPVRTGLTAASWGYEIEKSETDGYVSIVWYNTNIQNGVNVAVIIQTGHATRSGGWVRGVDYINPALTPIFEKIAEEASREVRK